jgi:ubiquinone/menaquinone biosynthesis C-methylase UbiE
MPGTDDHKQTVREAFTEQAEAYATNAAIADPERIDRLVQLAGGAGDKRVLEVATGPGHVALGFADVCEYVVGIDLTEAPLAIAAEQKRDRGVANVDLLRGDAETLPFSDDSFDIVVCRYALHHIENPSNVLQQMARVCRPGGTVAVADLVVSEHSHRADYQNELERLRDPSHVRALPISELLRTVADRGIEVEDVRTGTLVQKVDTWLDNADTPESRASEVREMMREDAEHDLSGTRPVRQDGDFQFVQRTAVVVGRVLDRAGEHAGSEFE